MKTKLVPNHLMGNLKTVELLDELAKHYGFGSAHNAITCADTYRSAYSKYQHKYDTLLTKFKAIMTLIDLEGEEENK